MRTTMVVSLAVVATIGALVCVAHAQGWDAWQGNVPDTNKPWIQDNQGNWMIDPAYEKTCWQAVAANQLSAAGYDPFHWEIYGQIYGRLFNVPGVPSVAAKWWLVYHGRNPDSQWYRPDNPYTDLVIHNSPGLFNPEGPEGPQADDWPADGAHAADYNQLLGDLNGGRYVNIGLCLNLESGGHAITLVGGNYAGNPNGNPDGDKSIFRDPDTGPDPSREPKLNMFDPWHMLWTVYYADVLRPGLRKPKYAETNYDVACCYADSRLAVPFRDAGTHGNELDWDDYADPEWLPGENVARIYGERFDNRAGHVYLLVDYATVQAGDPEITVTDNDGNAAEQVGPVRWSESQTQALLHYRFIEYDRDENGQLMDVRPYQPDSQTIEFPSNDYRDLEHSVIGWDVATFCAPERCRTFYATSDPAGAPPVDEAWTELGGQPPPMADELWFCHSNTYLADLDKIVDFLLVYTRHEEAASLCWDENDPALYGAGYYDDTLTPDFSNLLWSLDDPLAVDGDGNPDEEGDYIRETLHVHMVVGDHPDWEWIKVWNPAGYEIDSVLFDTQWTPEPATLALLAVGGLMLLLRRRAA